MNESPLSRSWRWGVEGVNKPDRLKMLDVEFHPRSLVWCVWGVCVCFRIGLGCYCQFSCLIQLSKICLAVVGVQWMLSFSVVKVSWGISVNMGKWVAMMLFTSVRLFFCLGVR